MLDVVPVRSLQLMSYLPIIGEAEVEALRAAAAPLRDARVLHVNATAFGGGVAEILETLVPLMADVGLAAEWQVIRGSDEFFAVSKASHNGLQGMALSLDGPMRRTWRHYNEQNAHELEGEYDFIIVHDPQPAGLLHYHDRSQAKGRFWIWRCHIDTSQPNPEYWDFYAPYIGEYDRMIFTMPHYAGPGIDAGRIAVIAPTIDPLSPKNRVIPPDDGRLVAERFGIDSTRPLLTQVSRFDPWKDPIGVIDAYRQVKAEIPDVQLALVGSMASDDPEGWTYLDRTLRYAGLDGDIVVLHNFHGVGAYEVGCFQTVADVVIQKSTREGFGLVVSEALWKGKPVVAGNVGGITLQVIEGETGYLVSSVEECASRTIELLQNRDLAVAMGEAGKEHVRRNFLTPRLLSDYLNLFNGLERVREATGVPPRQQPPPSA
ncbi:MAG TPA: glycosyltransferase [Anaerolineales bacterium]|nr:glycosyltransferase [Anaerolineales bacterium]